MGGPFSLLVRTDLETGRPASLAGGRLALRTLGLEQNLARRRAGGLLLCRRLRGGAHSPAIGRLGARLIHGGNAKEHLMLGGGR